MQRVLWYSVIWRGVLRGLLLAALIILAVLFSTGQESKFIYTDF